MNLPRRFPNRPITRKDERDASLMTMVVSLLENPARAFPNRLDIHGGDFEQLIWAAVRNIPPGKTKSAAEIAREIMAAPNARDSVLKICRDSNLAVVIPTHRIAEEDGSGSGFAWGEDKRTVLLAREEHQQRS
jgi:AraC family transcriptional regulator of adaptative response/methylated-DNA-[protein]-cysteine methyltransferase